MSKVNIFCVSIRLRVGTAYRLYTIIGRLLGLIDEITNWYIRFNRKRLKGENGKEDTTAALNTLFETLFTLTRTMVCVDLLNTHLDADGGTSHHTHHS